MVEFNLLSGLSKKRYLNLLENNAWQKLKMLASRFSQTTAPQPFWTFCLINLMIELSVAVVLILGKLIAPTWVHWTFGFGMRWKYISKANDIQELSEVVKQAANNLLTADFWKAVASCEKSAEACMSNQSGHFESEFYISSIFRFRSVFKITINSETHGSRQLSRWTKY